MIKVTYLIQWVCLPVFHKARPVYNMQRVFFITEHSPAEQAASLVTMQQLCRLLYSNCFEKYSQYYRHITFTFKSPLFLIISVFSFPFQTYRLWWQQEQHSPYLAVAVLFLIITQNDDTLVGLEIFCCAWRTQLEQFIVLSHIDPIWLLFPDVFKPEIIHKI